MNRRDLHGGAPGDCAETAVASSYTRRALTLLISAALILLAACTEQGAPAGFGTLQVELFPSGGPPATTAPLIANAWINHPPSTPPPTIIWGWSWTVNGVDAGISTQTVPETMTAKHEVWEVTATALIGSTSLGPDRANITIINTPPSVTVSPLDPAPNCPTSGITVVATPLDVDNDPVTLTYQWFLDRVEVPGATGDTLDCQYFSVGQRVFAQVKPNDGEVDGPLARTNQPVIRPPATPALQGPAASGSPYAPSLAETISSGSSVETRDTRAEIELVPAVDPLSLSESNVCRLHDDGAVECTGIEDFGVTNAPAGQFLHVEVGLDYACAIRSEDSSVVCWGAPVEDLGQIDPPMGAFTQIDLGSTAACGLLVEGEISCWGDDSVGQASPPDGFFTQLEMSDTYGCAIDTEALVQCWGLGEKPRGPEAQ